MIDLFLHLDRMLFVFINQSITNPLFDAFFPFLTDLNKHWYGLTAYAAGWLFLVIRCGRKGRIVACLIVVLVPLSDQLSSNVLKGLVGRPRPCHLVGGIPVMDHVRLLVDCGSGFSFPSSHAVNNFAVATLLSVFYRKWSWAYLVFASLMALSRPYVGVHYPSDIIGGALIGVLLGFFVIGAWRFAARSIPQVRLDP